MTLCVTTAQRHAHLCMRSVNGLSSMRATPAVSGGSLSLQATLLVSILVAFPEIGSVRFCTPDGHIAFTFTLGKRYSKASLSCFRRVVRAHLDAYSDVTCRNVNYLRITGTTYGSFTLVKLVRDVDTFSREELSLLVSLIRKFFGRDLVVEAEEPLGDEEQAMQEEIIEGILQDVRNGKSGREVVGFREAGRVMVFNRNPGRARTSQE